MAASRLAQTVAKELLLPEPYSAPAELVLRPTGTRFFCSPAVLGIMLTCTSEIYVSLEG